MYKLDDLNTQDESELLGIDQLSNKKEDGSLIKNNSTEDLIKFLDK